MNAAQNTTYTHEVTLPVSMMATGVMGEETAIGYEAGNVGVVMSGELIDLLAEFDEECLREREEASHCSCENCDDSWMLIF